MNPAILSIIRFSLFVPSIIWTLFGGQVIRAQFHLVPEWKISRVSSFTNGNSEGWGVDTDPGGNIYWSASFDSTSTNRLYDIMTYKFDPAGNQLWKSWYGGDGLQHAFVLNARDTSLYVGGRENVIWPYWSTECNMLLLKINKMNGALEDHKNIGFGTGGYDEMDAIEMNGTAIFCSGWAQVTPGVGNYEMGFLKLNYALGIEARKTFGILSAGSAEHQDGHIVLDSSNIFAAGLWNGHTGINYLADGRCLLGKFDLDWNVTDTILFGPALAAPLDLENALGSSSDGNSIYVTGYSCPVSPSDMQIIIARFDKNLNPIWINYFGGPGTESARGITCQGGYLYVCGTTNTPAFATGGAYDGLLLRIDTATGNQIDYFTWGDTKDNEFRDIAIHGNALYLSGTSGTNMFSGGTSDEAFLIKADLSALNGTRNFLDEQSTFSFYPNPAKNEIQIRSGEILSRVVLEDAFGKPVVDWEINGYDAKLSLNGLSPGIYFLEAFNKKDAISIQKIFILK